MKPTCLTPGCTQETGHVSPHGGKQMLMRELQAALPKPLPVGYGVAMGGTYHGPPDTPVTLEGLAAVISACGSAISSIGDWDGKAMADGHLLALIAKAREVACGKEQGMTAGEAVRSVHQRIAAMPPDEAERHPEAIAARDDAELKKATDDHAEHLRLAMQIPEHPIHRDIARGEQVLQDKAAMIEAAKSHAASEATRLYDETYNRAITDAHNAVAHELGLGSEGGDGPRAQAAIRKLYRSTP